MAKNKQIPTETPVTMTAQDLLDIAATAFQGRCDRFDSRVEVEVGVIRECSIYKMSDDLVRIDLKKAVQP